APTTLHAAGVTRGRGGRARLGDRSGGRRAGAGTCARARPPGWRCPAARPPRPRLLCRRRATRRPTPRGSGAAPGGGAVRGLAASGASLVARGRALVPRAGPLVCADVVGSAQYHRAPGERLGVSPLLRMTPPRRLLAVEPEHVLVGHGEGIHE